MKIRIPLLAAVAMLAAPSSAAACAGAHDDPGATTAKRTRVAVVCLVNAERAAAGIAPVQRDRTLAGVARRHATDMVARGYFAHDTPEGLTPTARIARSGWIPAEGAWYVGENLAWGGAGAATPRQIVRDWMNSPSHRENVLRPLFAHVGIGVVAGSPRGGGSGAFTYAAAFGRR